MWNPDEDGVTHINVYSKARTALGKALTNFAHTPFECEDGWFASVEAYWYWLGAPSHPRRADLRSTFGWEAKKIGRECNAPDWHENDPEFERKIKAAIDAKLRAHVGLRRELMNSTLPLTHYYVYGGKVVEPNEGKWVIAHLEQRRELLHKQKAGLL